MSFSLHEWHYVIYTSLLPICISLEPISSVSFLANVVRVVCMDIYNLLKLIFTALWYSTVWLYNLSVTLLMDIEVFNFLLSCSNVDHCVSSHTYVPGFIDCVYLGTESLGGGCPHIHLHSILPNCFWNWLYPFISPPVWPRNEFYFIFQLMVLPGF